jgi:hypothetical protein
MDWRRCGRRKDVPTEKGVFKLIASVRVLALMWGNTREA